MSDMKCPFCQQELDCVGKYTDGSSKWLCNKCGLFGDKKLFDEIIRTRKALEIAVDALKEYANEDNWSMGFAPWAEDASKDALYTEDGYKTANKALEQITAKQKDVK